MVGSIWAAKAAYRAHDRTIDQRLAATQLERLEEPRVLVHGRCLSRTVARRAAFNASARRGL